MHVRIRFARIGKYTVLVGKWSSDSIVGRVTCYGLDEQGVGVRVSVGSRIFSLRRPDRLMGSPSLLCSGYGGSFPGRKAAGACS
jgi:hypothetical protein